MNGQVWPHAIYFKDGIFLDMLWRWTVLTLIGARSFNRRSLHHIGNEQNPYEQAISIIGKTLSSFDEDNLIPCFGFGDGKLFHTFNTILDSSLLIAFWMNWQLQHMIKRFSVFTLMRDFVMDLKRCWVGIENWFLNYDLQVSLTLKPYTNTNLNHIFHIQVCFFI